MKKLQFSVAHCFQQLAHLPIMATTAIQVVVMKCQDLQSLH